MSCEEGNVYDKHAVAVCKTDGVVFGHAPREMSRAFWVFLQHGGTGKSFFAPRSFTRNSFHMTALFSLKHAFDI